LQLGPQALARAAGDYAIYDLAPQAPEPLGDGGFGREVRDALARRRELTRVAGQRSGPSIS